MEREKGVRGQEKGETLSCEEEEEEEEEGCVQRMERDLQGRERERRGEETGRRLSQEEKEGEEEDAKGGGRFEG